MRSHHVHSRPTMTNPTTRALLSNGFAIFNCPHPHRAPQQKSNAQICPNTGSFVSRGTPSFVLPRPLSLCLVLTLSSTMPAVGLRHVRNFLGFDPSILVARSRPTPPAYQNTGYQSAAFSAGVDLKARCACSLLGHRKIRALLLSRAGMRQFKIPSANLIKIKFKCIAT